MLTLIVLQKINFYFCFFLNNAPIPNKTPKLRMLEGSGVLGNPVPSIAIPLNSSEGENAPIIVYSLFVLNF